MAAALLLVVATATPATATPASPSSSSTTTTPPTTTPPTTSPPTAKRPPVPEPRIIGGTTSVAGAAPWMAALVWSWESSAYAGLYCGGTVIAPRWILTAAHCIEDENSGVIVSPTSLDVVTGRQDLTVNRGQRIHAAAVFVDPAYDREARSHDAGLIFLATPTTSPAITLVAPGQEAAWAAGVTSTVYGWGDLVATGTPQYPRTLQQLDTPILADSVCGAPSSYGVTYRPSSMLCAGYPGGGKDSCYGDSGGPLVVDLPDATTIEAGVVSWGDGCAEAGYPGIYTRLVAEVGWINGRRALGPYTSVDALVTRVHLEALGRFPTATEAAFWRYVLTAGSPPGSLYASVAGSTEARLTIIRSWLLYRAAFGRDPDPGGLKHWIEALRAKADPVWVASTFVASPEFQATYGSLDDPAFVDRLYANVLHRAADASGRAYWIGQLGKGRPRGWVLLTFAEAEQTPAQQVQLIRIAEAWAALQRPPTASEQAAFSATDVTALGTSFFTNLEYNARF